MKKLAIIAILIISVLMMGCATKEISTESESSKSGSYEDMESDSTASKTTSTKSKPKYSSSNYPTEVKGDASYVDTETGETVGFDRVDTVKRERTATEKCDMDYPLECSKFLAKDGIIYLTIKNQGYASNLDEVSLYFKGDLCDPSDVYMEGGQNTEFECYVDPDSNLISGSLEMEYFLMQKKIHDSKTGTLVVVNE